MWGPRPSDFRGYLTEDFINQFDLDVLNDPYSRPTYNSVLGESWIDLALSKNLDTRLIKDWMVLDDVTSSDHNLMVFTVDFVKYEGRTLKKRWKLRNLDWVNFQSRIYQLTEKNPLDDLNPMEIGSFVEEMEGEILNICKETELKNRRGTREKHVIWWSPELTSIRSRVRAFRRKYQKEQDVILRNEKRMDYKKELAMYRKRMCAAKKKHFQNYLERTVVQNAFGKLKKREQLGPIYKESGERIVAQDEVEKEILGFHFKEVVDYCSCDYSHVEDEPEIMEYEVENALGEMNVGRAPGFNGLELDIYVAVFLVAKSWFVQVLNLCFQAGIFPSVWKKARVILFLKEGKDRTNCGSYRPIPLLPVWGKVLDKILTKRLVYFLESKDLISRNRFGFRKGLSTLDAIRVLLEKIGENKHNGDLTCWVSLDIRNAFNSVRRYDILTLLRKKCVPKKLYFLITSFLEDRTYLTRCGEIYMYNLGVPQGSCVGPVLWLLVVNEVLEKNMGDKVYCQAYADDLVVLLGASACYRFSQMSERPLHILVEWAEEFRLEFSWTKCVYMVFPVKGQIGRRPTIKMKDINLKYMKEVKYLGVTLDSKLTWMSHLNRILDKVLTYENKIKQFSRATWGLRPQVLKEIYLRATEKFVLHGAPIWYGDTVRIKTKLNQIQLKALIGITKCYRTVSTVLLQVLAGCVPLDIKAEEEQSKYGLIHWNRMCIMDELILDERNCLQNVREFESPWMEKIVWDNVAIDYGWNIYTDASEASGKVGCAYMAYHEGELVRSKTFRLENASIFDGEAFAVLKAIDFGIEMKTDCIHICSDAKSVLFALSGKKSANEIIRLIRQKINDVEFEIRLH